MIRIAALNDSSSDVEGPNDIIKQGKALTTEAQEHDAHTLYTAALAYQKKDNNEKAAEILKKLLASDYLKTESHEDSRPDRLTPDLILKYSVLKNLADIYIKNEQPVSAIECLLEAVEIDDSEVSVLFKIGLLARQNGNYPLSAKALHMGIQLRPSHWPCLHNLISVLYIINNYEACLCCIRDALKLDAGYVHGLVVRSEILTEQPCLKWRGEDGLLLEELSMIDQYTSQLEPEEIAESMNPLLEERGKRIQAMKPEKKIKTIEIILKSCSWVSLGEELVTLRNELANSETFEHSLTDRVIIKTPEDLIPLNSSQPSNEIADIAEPTNQNEVMDVDPPISDMIDTDLKETLDELVNKVEHERNIERDSEAHKELSAHDICESVLDEIIDNILNQANEGRIGQDHTYSMHEGTCCSLAGVAGTSYETEESIDRDSIMPSELKIKRRSARVKTVKKPASEVQSVKPVTRKEQKFNLEEEITSILESVHLYDHNKTQQYTTNPLDTTNHQETREDKSVSSNSEIKKVLSWDDEICEVKNFIVKYSNSKNVVAMIELWLQNLIEKIDREWSQELKCTYKMVFSTYHISQVSPHTMIKTIQKCEPDNIQTDRLIWTSQAALVWIELMTADGKEYDKSQAMFPYVNGSKTHVWSELNDWLDLLPHLPLINNVLFRRQFILRYLWLRANVSMDCNDIQSAKHCYSTMLNIWSTDLYKPADQSTGCDIKLPYISSDHIINTASIEDKLREIEQMESLSDIDQLKTDQNWTTIIQRLLVTFNTNISKRQTEYRLSQIETFLLALNNINHDQIIPLTSEQSSPIDQLASSSPRGEPEDVDKEEKLQSEPEAHNIVQKVDGEANILDKEAGKQETIPTALDGAVVNKYVRDVVLECSEMYQTKPEIWRENLLISIKLLKQVTTLEPTDINQESSPMTVDSTLESDSVKTKTCNEWIEIIPCLIQLIVKSTPETKTKGKDADEYEHVAVCWCCLSNIIQKLEKSNNNTLPAHLRCLSLAHKHMSGFSCCTSADGVVLTQFVIQLSDTLESGVDLPPSITQDMRNKIEQCYFCLFGYPTKRTRYLVEHKSIHIKLTWNMARRLYMYYQPVTVPEFDSYKSSTVSTELETLLRRICSVIPDDLSPVPIVSDKISRFLDGCADLDEVRELTSLSVQTMSSDELCSEIYYLLGDYYFKNKQPFKAMKHYQTDLLYNPDRFDSWAGMALARCCRLENRLSATESIPYEGAFSKLATSTLCSFVRALDLQPRNIKLWIEYAGIAYQLHSYASRTLKSTREERSDSELSVLVKVKDDMLVKSLECYKSVCELTTPDSGDLLDNDSEESWLYQYMFGKIKEKLGKPILEYLQHYIDSCKSLEDEGATYPQKITFIYTPPYLALEALELHYRVHTSILNYVLSDNQLGQPDIDDLSEILNEMRKSAFVTRPQLHEDPVKSSSSQSTNLNKKRSSTNFSQKLRIDPILSTSPGNTPNVTTRRRFQLQDIQETVKTLLDNLIERVELDIDSDQPFNKQENKCWPISRQEIQPINNTQKDSCAQPIRLQEHDQLIKNQKPERGHTSELDQSQASHLEQTMEVNATTAGSSSEIEICIAEILNEIIDQIAMKRADNFHKSMESGSDRTLPVKQCLDDMIDQITQQENSVDSSKPPAMETSYSGLDSSDQGSSDSSTSSSASENGITVKTIISSCIQGLKLCITRYPLHYKSYFRLAQLYLKNPEYKDLDIAEDILLGKPSKAREDKFVNQGLFQDRKHNNFFNGVWRLPIQEIERAGSFSHHLSKLITLLLQLLHEKRDYTTLYHLHLQLNKIPPSDKKFLLEVDRLYHSSKALEFAIHSLYKVVGQPNKKDVEILALLQQAYKWYNYCNKVEMCQPNALVLLTKGYKTYLSRTQTDFDSSTKVDITQAKEFCQQKFSSSIRSASAASSKSNKESERSTKPKSGETTERSEATKATTRDLNTVKTSASKILVASKTDQLKTKNVSLPPVRGSFTLYDGNKHSHRPSNQTARESKPANQRTGGTKPANKPPQLVKQTMPVIITVSPPTDKSAASTSKTDATPTNPKSWLHKFTHQQDLVQLFDKNKKATGTDNN